jgi:methyl-accepting chemotaxis protein
MNPALLFTLVLTLGVLPLSYFVYWTKYRGTIIYKMAFAILAATYITTLAGYFVGYLGINNIFWYIPVGYAALLTGNVAFKRYVQVPVKKTTDSIDKISKGNLNIEIEEDLKQINDEIGQMNTSLDEMLKTFRETSEFARQVGEGNLDYEIKELSESDHLRQALLEMRDKLKEADQLEKEKRREEEQRRWSNEGLAKLNEILRQQEDIEEISYQIISFLVKYLEANQGGLFVRNYEEGEEPLYELKAAYAYSRRKYMEKEFKLGEGLVGTCALEKERIYMTNLPDEYVEITSGLGESTPGCLLVVPMKLEEEVYGVIEIASFKEFEEYMIDFVEQASLSIASTLNTVETNRRTRELLEKTQQQAEEMTSQEEEMRQNMEELKATQEESTRRVKEYESTIEEMNKEREQLEDKLEKAEQKIKELEKQLNKKKE